MAWVVTTTSSFLDDRLVSHREGVHVFMEFVLSLPFEFCFGDEFVFVSGQVS